MALKKLYVLSLILLCLSIHSGYAQETVVNVSEKMTLGNRDYYAVIGAYQDTTLFIRKKNGEFVLHAFDASMKETWSKNVPIEKTNSDILKCIWKKNHFLALYTYDSGMSQYLKMMRLSPHGVLEDTLNVTKLAAWKQFDDANFAVSENKRYVAMFYAFDANFQRKWYVNIIDTEKWQLVSKEQLHLEAYNVYDDFLQFFISNEGKPYLVMRSSEQGFVSRARQVDILTTFQHETKQFRWAIEGKRIKSMKLAIDNKHQRLVGAGLFYLKNSNFSEGYFQMEAPLNDLGRPTSTFDLFNAEFLTQANGSSNRRSLRGLFGYTATDIVLRQDKGVLIVFEKQRIFVRNNAAPPMAGATWDNGVNTNQIEYNYDDLVVLAINPNGETHWKTVLAKRQYSQDDDALYSSYFLMKNKTSLQFLYNDMIGGGATLQSYILNPEGGSRRQVIMNIRGEERLYPIPQMSVQVSANVLIIPSERMNVLQLIKIRTNHN